MPLYTPGGGGGGSFGNISASGNATISGNLTVAGRALRSPQAADHNIRAWSFDPRHCSSTATATAGTLFLAGLYIPDSFTATTLYWTVTSVAVTPTAGQNFVALYAADGTLVTSVGVDNDTLSTGLKTTTINSAVTTGTYWVGFLFNAATAPQLARAGGATGTSAFVNVGLSSATLLYATNGSSRTALPSPLTPASNVAGTAYWAAIA